MAGYLDSKTEEFKEKSSAIARGSWQKISEMGTLPPSSLPLNICVDIKNSILKYFRNSTGLKWKNGTNGSLTPKEMTQACSSVGMTVWTNSERPSRQAWTTSPAPNSLKPTSTSKVGCTFSPNSCFNLLLYTPKTTLNSKATSNWSKLTFPRSLVLPIIPTEIWI